MLSLLLLAIIALILLIVNYKTIEPYKMTIIENPELNMKGVYKKPVNFICWWTGELNEKHLYSIKSCYYFNVKFSPQNSIVLYLSNNTNQDILKDFGKYCKIVEFDIENELERFFLKNIKDYMKNTTPSYYSDLVRYILLYNYGGCWFDLDMYILRSFEPIFSKYEKEVCVYQWETQPYPNGAMYFSLGPKNKKLKIIIEHLTKLNRGFGFQESNLTFTEPVPLTVLPCYWFDPGWLCTDSSCISIQNFFKTTNNNINLHNFYPGCFSYHWHNKWNDPVEDNSPFSQLNKHLDSLMDQI